MAAPRTHKAPSVAPQAEGNPVEAVAVQGPCRADTLRAFMAVGIPFLEACQMLACGLADPVESRQVMDAVLGMRSDLKDPIAFANGIAGVALAYGLSGADLKVCLAQHGVDVRILDFVDAVDVSTLLPPPQDRIGTGLKGVDYFLEASMDGLHDKLRQRSEKALWGVLELATSLRALDPEFAGLRVELVPSLHSVRPTERVVLLKKGDDPRAGGAALDDMGCLEEWTARDLAAVVFLDQESPDAFLILVEGLPETFDKTQNPWDHVRDTEGRIMP